MNRPLKAILRFLFAPARGFFNSRFEHLDRRFDQLLEVLRNSGPEAAQLVEGFDKTLPVLLENLSAQNAAIREARLEAIELRNRLDELTAAVSRLASQIREQDQPAS